MEYASSFTILLLRIKTLRRKNIVTLVLEVLIHRAKAQQTQNLTLTRF